MTDELDALRAKVDAWCEATAARRADALVCRRGCVACCNTELEVAAVEAGVIERYLDARASTAMRARLAARGALGVEARRGRCVMLDDDDSCAIYENRPLVCRTQGHALRYPPGFVPVAAVRARAAGDVTWCPLNYVDAPPRPEDVLDAERIDVLLSVVDRRAAADAPRVSLRELARGVRR